MSPASLATLASHLPHRRVAAVVGALVLALVLTTVVVVRATGEASDAAAAERCARAEARSVERRGHDTGRGRDVVVIGDSYAVGAGTDPRTAWPARLPGRVHVDGFSGSGFSEQASPCGPVSYADRAARALAGHPDAVVVVQGGLNDHRQADRDIEQGFERLVDALAGHPVLVVGPPPAPMRADEVPRVDAVLARLTSGAGATYLSLADTEIDYLDDDLHPSVRGHRRLGDLVAAALLPLMGFAATDGPAGHDRRTPGPDPLGSTPLAP